ncbi:hypothetical protein [Mesorhizobium sp. SP-1A]|uniref:hypothetical protein n=1 Tax=Mesorhizobium sp. SP-1A TaxID=3077840 RepID=UPI0028F70F10|nr:hypothetical protein [Mesorhizobium sp. SP-1A]
MAAEGDRLARAGDYVFGLMNEGERERAERDLERDPAFRDAVLALAARMHVFDRAGPAETDRGERWEKIARNLAGLPQMRAPATGENAPRGIGSRSWRDGLNALQNRYVLATILGLSAAFVLGYLMARL